MKNNGKSPASGEAGQPNVVLAKLQKAQSLLIFNFLPSLREINAYPNYSRLDCRREIF
jgi:hypothetical protein